MAGLVLALLAPVASGALLHQGTFSGPGSGAGQLTLPERAAVEQSTGNLFVVDSGNDRVQVFAPDGSTAAFLTEFGSGTLDEPLGIAIAESGGQTSVYVTSQTGGGEIVKFDSDEAATPSFSVDATYDSPAQGGGAGEVQSFRSAIALAGDGDLWVADSGANVVKRFDSTGAHVAGSNFDGSDGGSAFTGLLDIAVNSTGDVYLIDANGPIETGPSGTPEPSGTSLGYRYGADGAHKATFTQVGPNQRAATVAVDKATDTVVISGAQDAIYSDGRPTLSVFDSSDTWVEEASATPPNCCNTISALAFAEGDTARLYVVQDYGYWSDGGTYGSEPAVQVFEDADLTPPQVAIFAPTDVAESSASLSGTVDPQGYDTTWQFEVAVAGSENWQPVPGGGTFAGSDPPGMVSGEITGLAPETEYEVRLYATSSQGNGISPSQNFTTLFAPAPIATIEPPTPQPGGKALLSGTVNPEGYETQWRFQYSLEGSGSWITTEVESAGDGTAPVTVEATTDVLQPNSTYQVRLIATGPAGTDLAGPIGFDTEAVGPGVETRGVVRRSAAEATLRAEIDPNNEPTSYRFEYGTAPGEYDITLPAASAGSGPDPISVLAPIEGLDASTTYYYRVVAENGVGAPLAGEQMSFETRAAGPTPSSGRVYEMVSPSWKNGGEPGPGSSLTQAAVGGEKIVYTAPTAFPGSEASGIINRYLSKRTADGWKTDPITPASGAPPYSGGLFNETIFQVFNDDLSRGVLTSQILPPEVPKETRAFYRWTDDPRALEYISEPQTPLPFVGGFESGDRVVGGSADLETVVFQSRRHYLDEASTPGTSPGYTNLYEWRGGELRLVSVLPETDHGPLNGQPVPYDAVAGAGGVGITNFRASQEVSDDGSRIFFTADLNEIINYNTPTGVAGRLYVREDGETTTWVSKSQRTTPDPGGERDALYWAITPDGGQAFFTSAEKLTDNSTARKESEFTAEDFAELYRYDVDGGGLVDLTAGLGLGDVRSVLGVSDDGSRVYFVASPTAGGYTSGCSDCQIYLWEDGEVRRVTTTPLLHQDEELFDGSRVERMNFSVDAGGTLSFVSRADLTGAGYPATTDCVSPGQPAAPCQQIYLYDPAADELSCASCPSGDALPASNSNYRSPSTAGNLNRVTEYAPRTLYADGSRLAFNTAEPLLPGDTNELVDVYEYDAELGRLRLISDGAAPRDSYLLDAGADGTDVFIWTRAPLVGADIDEAGDVYDARVGGGGFPNPPQSTPCSGDLCQGAPTPPPAGRSPGSNTYQGSGNPPSANAAACGRFRQQANRKQARAKRATGKKQKQKLRKQAARLKKKATRCERGSK